MCAAAVTRRPFLLDEKPRSITQSLNSEQDDV